VKHEGTPLQDLGTIGELNRQTPDPVPLRLLLSNVDQHLLETSCFAVRPHPWLRTAIRECLFDLNQARKLLGVQSQHRAARASSRIKAAPAGESGAYAPAARTERREGVSRRGRPSDVAAKPSTFTPTYVRMSIAFSFLWTVGPHRGDPRAARPGRRSSARDCQESPSEASEMTRRPSR
jgi:hypothetical protein